MMLCQMDLQSNASINRGAASLGVPGWINLEIIECKVPQSVPKEGDEKNNESCLSSLHSENTKLSPEVKSMVLDFKKNSEKPVKCNIVRQKMARFIAQQCRNKSTNESIFAAIPKNVASDTVKSKSSLVKVVKIAYMTKVRRNFIEYQGHHKDPQLGLSGEAVPQRGTYRPVPSVLARRAHINPDNWDPMRIHDNRF